MYILLAIFSFILGTIIGSFLNVVIIRHGTGMGLGGRSRCMTSGKTLRWYELIPIFSFLIQRGRSRYDGSKISLQYPIVEFITGVLFFLSFHFAFTTFGLMYPTDALVIFLFFIVVSSYSILVSVYDARHMIIPNQFIYPLIILSFAALFVDVAPLSFSIPTAREILAGPIVVMPFIILWLVSGGKWMGFADSKIALAIGWFLGVEQGLIASMIGFWIGALIGIVILAYVKYVQGRNMRYIPFGPFLLTGLIITFLYNIHIDTIINFLYGA